MSSGDKKLNLFPENTPMVTLLGEEICRNSGNGRVGNLENPSVVVDVGGVVIVMGQTLTLHKAQTVDQ